VIGPGKTSERGKGKKKHRDGGIDFNLYNGVKKPLSATKIRRTHSREFQKDTTCTISNGKR